MCCTLIDTICNAFNNIRLDQLQEGGFLNFDFYIRLCFFKKTNRFFHPFFQTCAVPNIQNCLHHSHLLYTIFSFNLVSCCTVCSYHAIFSRNATTSPTIMMLGFLTSFALAISTIVPSVPVIVCCCSKVPICTNATGVDASRPYVKSCRQIYGKLPTPI